MKVFAFIILFSIQCFAQVSPFSAGNHPLNWSVGDTADYELYNHKSKAKELVTFEVTKILGGKAWLEYTMLHRDYVLIYDMKTGELLELWVNGKKAVLDKQPLKPIEEKTVSLTVPAGTFTALYSKYEESWGTLENWINEDKTSFANIIKSKQSAYMGREPWLEMTLLSFKQAN